MVKMDKLHRLRQGLMVAFLAIGWATGPCLAHIEIIRDSSGMAHVYGDSNNEVFYGFGYIMAKDRLFQMEMRKRQTLGRTAEVLGLTDTPRWANKFLEKDTEARQALDLGELETEYDQLSAKDRGIIEAFTNGVNAFIDEAEQDEDGKLSKLFFDYNIRPEHWTPLQTLAVAVDVMGSYAAFTTQDVNMRLYAFLRQAYPDTCDDVFDQFVWLTDPNAPTTKMDHQLGGANPDQPGARGCSSLQNAPNGLRFTGEENVSTTYSVQPQIEARRESMAWAVGRNKAEGFNSIFFSGPQTGWHSPSVYYPVGLHGGDFDMAGSAVIGTFFLRIGSSHNISWGSTSGLGSTVDVYQEILNEDRTQYWYKGAWHPIETRHETIHVRDGDDVPVTVQSTVHGVITATEDDHDIAYSQRIAWKGAAAQSIMAWLHSGTARDFDEWLHYAHQVAFNYNFFYADKDGNVGFAHTGWFPIRPAGDDVRLPVIGDGSREWEGFKPEDQNPSELTQDAIVNFNNKPTRDWPNSGLFWEQWSEASQAQILINEIEKKDRFDWDDIAHINKVVSFTDVSAAYFIPFIAKAGQGLDPASPEAQAIDHLTAWDHMRTPRDDEGDMDVGQAIFDAWLPVMVNNTLGPSLEGFADARSIWLKAGSQTGLPRLEEHPTAATIALHHALLNSEGRSGAHHYYNFFGNKSANEVILESLDQALAALAKKFKTDDMTAWRQKVPPHVFFESNTNRIIMTEKAARFRLPTFMNRGVINLQTAYGLDGKSMRSGYINPPGVSGHIAKDGQWSPYLDNQLDAYQHFEYFPLYLDRADVEQDQAEAPIELEMPN